MRRPAAEKRQGTKSREVWQRWCNGRYGDLMAAPISMLDVTPTGRGRGICTQARLEAWNRHLGKRSERINERTVRRAQRLGRERSPPARSQGIGAEQCPRPSA